MFFISDVHANFSQYDYIREGMTLPDDSVGMDYSIQLGDMGIGFNAEDYYTAENKKNGKTFHTLMSTQKHKFIHGNHDDPDLCETSPNFLGRYGYNSNGIFYVSGGLSIDRRFRTVGVSYWENEEVNFQEQEAILKLYKKTKPRIVCTHDAPTLFRNMCLTNPDKTYDGSVNVKLFDEMFKIHKPEYWICGHHHTYVERKYEGTQFVALLDVPQFHVSDTLDKNWAQMYSETVLWRCIYHIENVKW